MWFVVAPPGVVYLFGFAFSVKARRWARDPWVRLTVPGTGVSAEGVAHFVGPEEIDAVADMVVEHWSMQGAPTIPACGARCATASTSSSAWKVSPKSKPRVRFRQTREDVRERLAIEPR